MKESWPSVTQILQPWQDFSHVPPGRLQEAAGRGKEIHAICANIALDLWVPDIPDNCKGYIESFRLWLPVVEGVIAVEKRLYSHTYRFKGRLDFICLIQGDKGLTVVDLKSPVAKSKTWPLQTAAYRHLALMEWPNITRIATLQLSPEGKSAKLREYTGSMERDFAVFLNCLTAFNYFKKEK